MQQQTVVVNAEELAGGEYALTNLTDCTVHLQGPMSSLQIRDLVNCTVSTGPVTGPTFVYGELLLKVWFSFVDLACTLSDMHKAL